MKPRQQRVPGGLASSRVAHAWRDECAGAAHAIGVADVLVNTQDEAAADGLASCRVAHTWRGGGAEAGQAIGVADVLVDTQDEATAAVGTRWVSAELGDTRLEI